MCANSGPSTLSLLRVLVGLTLCGVILSAVSGGGEAGAYGVSLPSSHVSTVAALQPASLGIITGTAQPCGGVISSPSNTYVVVSVSSSSQLVARDVVLSGSNYWLSVPAGSYQVSLTNASPAGVPDSFASGPPPATTVTVGGSSVTLQNFSSVACA